MTGRPVAEREANLAYLAAHRKAEERYADSAIGMQDKAGELRRGAAEMIDSNDRDAMLRVAAGYERRADEALRRAKRVV